MRQLDLNARPLKHIPPGGQKPSRWSLSLKSTIMVSKMKAALSKLKTSPRSGVHPRPDVSESSLASGSSSRSDVDSVVSSRVHGSSAATPDTEASEQRPASTSAASATVDVTNGAITSADTDRSHGPDSARMKDARKRESPMPRLRLLSWLNDAPSLTVLALSSTGSMLTAELQRDYAGLERSIISEIIVACHYLTTKIPKQRKKPELSSEKSSDNHRDPPVLKATKKALPPSTDLVQDSHLQTPVLEGPKESPLPTTTACHQHGPGNDQQSTTSNKRGREGSDQGGKERKRNKGRQPEGPPRERGADDKDGDDDDDGDPPDGNPPNRAGCQPDGKRELACPYYRYDPVRHRECLFRHRLTRTNDVWQHLRRRHGPTIRCPICGEKFAKQSLMDAHVSARSCKKRTFRHPGMTHEEREALDRICKEMGKVGPNEAERWFRVWDVLFPGVRRPDSPHLEDPTVEIVEYWTTKWLEHGKPEEATGIRLSQEHYRRIVEAFIGFVKASVREGPRAGDSQFGSLIEHLSQEDSFSRNDVVEQGPGNYAMEPSQDQPGPSGVRPSSSLNTWSQNGYAGPQPQQPQQSPRLGKQQQKQLGWSPGMQSSVSQTTFQSGRGYPQPRQQQGQPGPSVMRPSASQGALQDGLMPPQFQQPGQPGSSAMQFRAPNGGFQGGHALHPLQLQQGQPGLSAMQFSASQTTLQDRRVNLQPWQQQGQPGASAMWPSASQGALQGGLMCPQFQQPGQPGSLAIQSSASVGAFQGGYAPLQHRQQQLQQQQLQQQQLQQQQLQQQQLQQQWQEALTLAETSDQEVDGDGFLDILDWENQLLNLGHDSSSGSTAPPHGDTNPRQSWG